MRHQRSGKKLGRDASHRRALYANLAGALIEHGRIRTTVAKAKAVRPIAEQMITLGRRGDLHARRQAVAFLRSKDVVHKLFAEVGPAFASRPGGYTRIVRIGPRHGDASELAYLELVDSELVPKQRVSAASAEPVTEADRSEGEEEADESATEAALEGDEGEESEQALEDGALETELAAEAEHDADAEQEPDAEADAAEVEAEAEPAAEDEQS